MLRAHCLGRRGTRLGLGWEETTVGWWAGWGAETLRNAYRQCCCWRWIRLPKSVSLSLLWCPLPVQAAPGDTLLGLGGWLGAEPGYRSFSGPGSRAMGTSVVLISAGAHGPLDLTGLLSTCPESLVVQSSLTMVFLRSNQFPQNRCDGFEKKELRRSQKWKVVPACPLWGWLRPGAS